MVASGSEVTEVRDQVGVGEAVAVTAGPVGFSSGKEKASPGRPADADPPAPDSESVIVAMERVSVLFDRYGNTVWVCPHPRPGSHLQPDPHPWPCLWDASLSRIRKGFPSEARVVARILPQFLDDFFPPQDVMNKVIGEFLSNQQPYPQFMASVVYKVSGE